jgi:hypothetical protein
MVLLLQALRDGRWQAKTRPGFQRSNLDDVHRYEPRRDNQETTMSEPRPPEMPQITEEQINQTCRPPALRFSKEIIEFANKKFDGYAPFWAPLVAAFTTKSVLIVSLMENFEPGSEEGLRAINTFFDRCKFEVATHWQSDGLKKLSKKRLSIIP